MRLYLRTGNTWTHRFMEKIADKIGLSRSQVYKWCWDRAEMEKKQRLALTKMKVLPTRIWYVTKVRRRRINKVNLFLRRANIQKSKKFKSN